LEVPDKRLERGDDSYVYQEQDRNPLYGFHAGTPSVMAGP
jgi:hypothetical protein